MADELRLPDGEPGLEGLGELDADQLRQRVKAWVLWWVCRQDAPTQAQARKALTALVGDSVRREYRLRWVRSVFDWLSDRPSSLRDQNALRAFMVDKQMVMASRAARAANQAIPNEREMSKGAGSLESVDIERLSKIASNLGNLAIKGFEGVAKLMQLDKLPPDVELSHQDVDDLLELLPRALASFDDEQRARLLTLIDAARPSDDTDTASKAGL